jgi:hypothetical protein
MAYLRYSKDCEWHVFEERKTGGVSYTAAMIQKMLELEDYSGIPGYQPRDKRMLRQAFDAWLSEQSSAEI